MDDYDLNKGNAPFEEKISDLEIYFKTKKIGKPEAKVLLESKINKVFKKAAGVDVKYLDITEYYEPYIHVSGRYRIIYLKRNPIELPISHEVIGAKVCPDCDKVYEVGEALEGETKKKRNLPIDVVLKLIHESGDVDLAFDYKGSNMDSKKIIDWKKENGPSNFVEQNKKIIRRFSVTTQEAIDRLRKKIAIRPHDTRRILEEVFEVTKNEIL
ncbi:MAG: hypothetical protein HWN67_19545, partial [Candidatus Helarchaeota archaeon]|nr:hypothetical protein [Candidatus Helarchaeota archaeon]